MTTVLSVIPRILSTAKAPKSQTNCRPLLHIALMKSCSVGICFSVTYLKAVPC